MNFKRNTKLHYLPCGVKTGVDTTCFLYKDKKKCLQLSLCVCTQMNHMLHTKKWTTPHHVVSTSWTV
jgi:hypothetical protein